MSEFTYTFTVFTPTYNRAHLIHGVYNSLLKQTFKDFEWIVVDDGSTDNTAEIVEEWIKQSPFPIRYFRQEHQHKKVAHNLALKKAKGELFIVFDSDDECRDNTLERFIYHWNRIPEELRQDYAGVTVHAMDENGKIIGDLFPCNEYMDSTPAEMTYKYKVKGEKWWFQRTIVLRQYPFPEDIPGYVPEGLIWLEIGNSYKMRYVNEALRIYHTKHTDRIMRAKKTEHLHGMYVYLNYTLQVHTMYFKNNFFFFLKQIILWLYAGIMTRRINIKDFNNKKIYIKILTFLLFPGFMYLFLRNSIIDTYRNIQSKNKRLNNPPLTLKKLDVR